VAPSGGLHENGLAWGQGDGLISAEMLAVIVALTRRNFYTSMTTYADHRIWQDVYHAATLVRNEAYIKITLRERAPVIQFKER
jgi:motility quorum-sensing regulator / GCU-specific mRNA interferase toxin